MRSRGGYEPKTYTLSNGNPLEAKENSAQSVQEHFSPQELLAIIDDVISGDFKIFDCEKMADYSANFQGAEPVFLNIWTHVVGYGFGYIVFHEFLRRVGEGKTFLSTDFTEAGTNLFNKAQTHGLIQKIETPINIGRYTRWKVIGDINQNLEKLKRTLH